MRLAARVDSNQKVIVEALRKCGASVRSLAQIGDDFPDVIVGFRNLNFLLEIKDGSKPPSRRKLRPGQRVFHATWQGQIAVVTSVDEALETVGLKTN
jgi:hypothetical protein